MSLHRIEIIQNYANGYAGLPLGRPELKMILTAMLKILDRYGINLHGIELYLVDDREQARLNSLYLHCSGPTNIISFPSEDLSSGILVLSLNTFTREARFYGQDKKDYLIRLLAHGMGHLAGYGHGPRLDEISGECLKGAEKSLLKEG